tara:strand:+ start:115 stop:417 length:303 start_codon:yes stop_codon:yes gene_type:complete
MQNNKKNSITKKDISKKISSVCGIPISFTDQIIEDFINILKLQIKENDLNITNFATFKVIDKPPRVGRNPKNKKIYMIDSMKTLKFNVSKKLDDKMKNIS